MSSVSKRTVPPWIARYRKNPHPNRLYMRDVNYRSQRPAITHASMSGWRNRVAFRQAANEAVDVCRALLKERRPAVITRLQNQLNTLAAKHGPQMSTFIKGLLAAHA